MEIDALTAEIIDASIRIHRELGPGLLESVYETVLAGVLTRKGLHVQRQLPVDIVYDELRFAGAFRVDLLVEHEVVIEVKSVEQLSRAHAKQLLTYLRLSNRSVGLLLNFSGATMKEGIRRIVNDYRPCRTPSASPRLRVNQISGTQI